jgi:hypothetical protein
VADKRKNICKSGQNSTNVEMQGHHKYVTSYAIDCHHGPRVDGIDYESMDCDHMSAQDGSALVVRRGRVSVMRRIYNSIEAVFNSMIKCHD